MNIISLFAQLFTTKFDKVCNSVCLDKNAMNDVLDKVEKQIADFDDSGIEDSLFSMADFILHRQLTYVKYVLTRIGLMETWDYSQIISLMPLISFRNILVSYLIARLYVI